MKKSILFSLSILSIVLFFCLSLTASAQKDKNKLAQTIRQTAEKSVDYYYDIYKTIHANPELSLHEEETSKLVAEEMRRLGLEVTENVGGFGVVGVFRNGEGPVIMLRADMDALPVKEATGLTFASTKLTEERGVSTPIMHACGHDMHSTVLLGTLSSLVENKKAWKGTLLAVAQPAEEVGQGALNMIKDGLFERFPRPDRAFGFHVGPEFPAGTIGYTKGAALAGVRDVDITFYGKGSHGAFPHNGIDPILMAASAVLEFQTIITRNVIASEPAVLTVGAFNGGTRPNIIPDKVELKITVRYFNEEVGNLIERRIREISNATSIAFGMDKLPDIRIHDQLPPVINDIELSNQALASMAKIIGEDHLIESSIHMVAEDFAFYSGTIPAPTVLFWLGASKSATEISGPLHSPTFHPEFHEAFITGVSTMTAAVIGL